MRKILILSYFFPPANFAGSYRMKAWAENLHKFGYYPIVVTRHWEENETDYTAISEEREIKKEEHGYYTVYRLPYKGSLRDRLIKRFGPKAKLLGKILSFFQVIGQNYFLFSIPYRNLYVFSRSYLKENPDIKILLTSGRPFIHFRFAWLLKKEFPYLKWVADYRDPWNSWSEINKKIKLKFFRFFEQPLEKKWISNAAFFTTCSDGFVENINNIHSTQGYVVTNGFVDFYNIHSIGNKDHMSIGYIGSLYGNQQIEVFLKGFISFIDLIKYPHICIEFFGLKNYSDQERRIRKYLESYEENFIIHPWLKKEKMIQEAAQCDYFLLCGIPDQKGRHTAKLFDYFSLQKNIILSPTDNDILEQVIRETGSGVILNDSVMVTEWLNASYSNWQKKGPLQFQGDKQILAEYKYENQVKKLSELLDKI